MSKLWWSEWRDLYFELATLGTSSPWDIPKGGKRIYSDGNFSFTEKEIGGQYDYLEEQLWSFRNGLSDISLHIEVDIPRRRKPKRLTSK